MLPGVLTASPVRTPAAVVSVANLARPILSCTVTRELVGSRGGINSAGQLAATGTVEWDVDAAGGAAHPWRPGMDLPEPGERVDILTGLSGPSGSMWPTLTRGIIDKSAGRVSDGALTSGVLDAIDQLNRPVTVPAKLTTMWPLVPDGPVRNVGLTSAHLTDVLFRAGGYYATPPEQTGAIFSATMMGCLHPGRGQILSTQSTTPIPLVGPQGVYCTNVDVTYLATGGHPGDHELTLNVHPAVGASNQVEVRVRNSAGTDGYSLLHTGADNLIVIRREGGTTTEVATLPRLGATRCAVRFTSGGTGVELRTSDGRSVTGTQAAMNLGSAAWTVQVTASGPVGAVLIGAPTGPFSALTHVPTAEIVYPTGLSVVQMTASPDLVGRKVIDWIAEQRAAMWADLFLSETGVLTWCHRDVLDARVSMTTKVAATDLYDLEWAQDSDMLRSAVRVSHSVPTISLSSRQNITLHTGPGETLVPNQRANTVITVPADEDWHGVDDDPEYAGRPAGPGDDPFAFDKGFNSWVGGYHVNPEGESTGWFTAAEGFSRIIRIGPRTLLHEMQINAITAGRTVVQRASPSSAGLWPIRQDQSLPVVRGQGRTQWDTQTHTVTAGPAHLPVLDHDVDFWVQGSAVSDLTDWLSDRTMVPTTFIQDIPLEPDPRIQLGDKITILDPDLTGLALTGVVVGDAKTVRVASYEQAVKLRLTSVVLTPRMGDVDAATFAGTLGGVDDLYPTGDLGARDDLTIG